MIFTFLTLTKNSSTKIPPPLSQKKTDTPLLVQLYGDRKYHFYNTPFKSSPSSKFKPDEPDNYIQIQGRLKGNWLWSLFYNKQKTQPLSNGFKQEANSAVEFGVSYNKTFYESRVFNVSYNVSLTAGPSFTTYKFQDINTNVSIDYPSFHVNFSNSNKYYISGFGTTAVGRIDVTTLRIVSVFVSVQVHHYSGRTIETGLKPQKFGYIDSGAVYIGGQMSIGGRKRRVEN